MMQSKRTSLIQREMRKWEKDELRQTVAELMAEEMKNMKNEDEKGVESLRAKFVENVSLVGLTEAIKSKHRIIKILWVIIFIGGLVATGYFLYRIADEYRRYPTATKVKVTRQPTYPFPPVVLCLDTWINAQKATDMGFSRASIDYALRYLMLFEDVGGQIVPSANVSTALDEFYEAYERNNYTSLVQFFKDIAVDMVLDSTNPLDVAYSCNRCESRGKLEKVVMNTGVCHRLVLKDVDGKLRQSCGLPAFRLRVPDLSQRLVRSRGYWKLYIKPLVRQLVSSSPYISIYPRHSQSVKISAQRYDMVDKEGDRCVINDPTVRLDNTTVHSSLSCSLNCSCKFLRRLHGCTVLNLATDSNHPLDEYCNTYYWKEWPVNGCNQSQEKSKRDSCIQDCPNECSVIMYDTMIDRHPSNDLISDEEEWYRNKSNKVQLKTAKIYFINAAVLAGGVITYEEVYTYSFESLVGNVGGTCGIWIGVSIMTLIQLLMFCVEQSLQKGAKLRLYQTYKADQKEETEGSLV